MNITKIVNETGCFDLQFRRDVKHNRTNKPVYYGWKAQFVIMGKYNDEDLLREIQNSLDCGRLHFLSPYSWKRRGRRGRSPLRPVGENKIRYSVQDIDSLYNKVVPFFKKYRFSENKKQDFEWWAKAIEVLYQNKGKTVKGWKKEDFLQLIKIQKIMQKYKSKKTRAQKWLSVAESIVGALR